MCPLYPFQVALLYICLLLPLLLAVVEASDDIAATVAGWNIAFLPSRIDKLQENNSTEVTLACFDCKNVNDSSNVRLVVYSEDPHVASVVHEDAACDNKGCIVAADFKRKDSDRTDWYVHFNVTAHFLGFTQVGVRLEGEAGAVVAEPKRESSSSLFVSVVRKKTLQSKVFAYSVAILISLAYVNMGCAMDLAVVRETVRRPVGPLIGFASQFVIMPLLAFALGFLFDSAAMRLGLFVTGTAPGGGASNIWTLLFGGNLNLSLTMTTISTFAAFAMMPLWIFLLGRVIFSDSAIVIPYHKIFTYAFCLVVPLSVGALIGRFCPRVSAWMVRVLKPLALFLIVFILVFGVWANLYMFKLMSWRVLLCGMCLPWMGFALGCTLARVCGRSVEDVVAIAIETGVQNTGVAIFVLWFTLDHPLGDMAAVVPVAVATMTPLPLLAALCMLKIRRWATAGNCAQNNRCAGNEFKHNESNKQLMLEELECDA